MRHLKYLLCLISILGVFTGQGFSQKLIWSDNIRGDSYNYMQILGPDEEGFFVLKSNLPLSNTKQSSLFRKREYHVIYYDAQMNQRWAKTLTGWNKEVRVERVLFANYKVLVFFSQINTDTKQFTLYAQWLSGNGILEGEAVKLMHMNYDKKSDLENLELYTSRDQSKIACVFGVKIDANESQGFQTLVINEALETISNKEFTLPYSRKRLEPINFSLSNSGQLNLLSIKYHTDDHEKTSGKYNYTVFLLNPQKDSLAAVDILLNDKTPSEVAFTIDNINKKIILCGFYSGKTGFSAAGTFYASIDAVNGSLQSIHAQPFTDEFLLKFPGERKANAGKELMNYNIDKIVLRNDGGAVISAEAFYTTSSSYYDIFTHTYISRINYNYNNVMILSVNPDGNMDWGQVIQKSQVSTEDGGFYSSYCTLTYQDRLFYIYNDFSGRRNRVIMYTFTNKGLSNKTDLLTESNESILVAKAAKQIDDNMLLLPAEKNGKMHYLKIIF